MHYTVTGYTPMHEKPRAVQIPVHTDSDGGLDEEGFKSKGYVQKLATTPILVDHTLMTGNGYRISSIRRRGYY